MRSISSSSNRASLSYLLTFGIVAFTRYSIYPWLLLHIQARKYESWAQAVVSYGALLTFMNMGSAVGQSAATYSKQLSNSFFMVSLLSLTSSYISLAFVTRFAIMSMSMFSIGFSGALLSGFSLNLDTGSPSISFHRKNSEVDTNSNLERGVICFIFSTILSSILYDPRAFINYPAYYLALFLGAAFTIMMLYYLVLARAIAQKTGKVKVIGRSGGSNNSGLLGNGNSASMRSINNDVESEVAYTGDVPLNFLSCCRGDLNKARKMYGKMLAWRKQNDVDNIFEQPQRFFKEILEYYPHGIHGYSLDGCGVVYEVLGRGNPSGLAKTGIEIDELVWHFNIRNELVFNKLCDPATLQEAVKNAPPGAITITPFPYMGNSNISNANLPPGVMLNQPIPRLMTVIDVQGISITSVTTQVISFIKKSGEIIDNYYPEQVARLVVCRAPRWFSTIWTVIARVLPEAVQKKVDILYDTKGLDKYIHPSQRPKEYGGTDVDLGEWVGHKMFVQISENWKNLSANTNTQSNANPSNKKLSIQTDGLDGDVNTNTNIPTSTRSTASRLTSFLSSNNLTGVNNNNNAAANTNNSSNSVTPKSSGNNTDNSNNNNNNKGVMGWIVNRFTGGGNKPTTAYLGEKNSYRYNAASGMWELDLENFYDNDNQNSFQEDKSGSKNTAFDSRKSQNRNQSSQKASSVMHSDEEEDDDDDVSLIESGTATATSGTGNSGVNNNTSMASPRLSADQVHKRKGRRNKKQHMTQEQIEEHGLVLAIQAAHFASQYAAQQQQQQLGYSQAELGGSSPVGSSGIGGVRRGLEREYSDTLDNSSNNLASSTSSSGSAALNNTGSNGSGSNNIWGVGLGANSGAVNSSNSSSINNHNWHNQSNKLSSSIFLIAILLFVLTTSMQMMLTTLLPVWLCAPLKSGGLGYNVKDLGLQLSCTGLLVLHCHLFFSSKFDHILRASPVRALRIGCGWMCLSLFALPLYARWFTVPLEDVLHHSSGHDGSHHFGLDETEERSTALWRWHHHHMQAMLQEAESAVLSSLRGLSPTTSLASLLLCAVLITTLVCTAHLARRAAGILLHLVLSSVFQSPANIRHALYSLSDILGPLLSCVVYSVVYSSHIKFPLNSSFFFAFSASMAVLAYMLSIFLVVHFRGDYGVMSDYQDWRSLAKHYSLVNTCLSWCNNTNSSNSNSVLNSRNSVYSKKGKSLESLGHKISSGQRGSGNLSQRHTMNNSNSAGDLAEERGRSSSFDSQSSETSQSLSFLNNEANDNHLLALPLGDINLLFSTVGQGYGSKLYNLKDDFKDV